MASKTESEASREGIASQKAAAADIANAAGHDNMLQLIELRWLAVAGQITTILVVTLLLGIRLPLPQMLSVLACLIAFNIGSHLRWHEQRAVTNGELFLALLVDIASLTAQLYFSGGTTNPFAFLFLLQVILGAVLIRSWLNWTIVAITCVCMAGLSVFHVPLALPIERGDSYPLLYVRGMLICFLLDAALLVFFIKRISRNLRTADAQLADLRQRTAEEEHIVRMGLLASGAAHELGTPMATMSVILGDWKHMPEFRDNPDLEEEITEMENQLQRCKKIVSGILLSAGETRGEFSAKTTICTFLNDIAKAWRVSRPIVEFVYENRIAEDLPVVFDSTLKQTIFNILDNAFEASPQWLSMTATREGDALKVTVTDAGPGFAPAMLAQFGKPYQSSKGRPGGGLGLFLAVNVSRTLGGTVSARNREKGGAVVELCIPLSAIALEGKQGHVI
jgi:two-component system, sensor histidine kinase RegB